MTRIDISRLPVRPDQKIASVLKEHPELLDVLVAQSPAFNRLKNPLMRRTFARMASIEHAAGVAGVPLADLLHALNSAVGVTLDPAELAASVAEARAGDRAHAPTGTVGGAGREAAAPTPPVVGAILGGAPPGPVESDLPPAWLGQAPIVTELDAREMQQRGEDPFFAIQDTARTVPHGKAFRLRNTFQPFPLYGVLGAKGFAHWVEELGPDDWLITFYREQPVSADTDADDTHPHGAVRPATMPPATGASGTAAGGVASAAAAAGAAAAGIAPDSGAAAAPAGDIDAAADIDALFAADGPPAEDLVAAVVTIVPEDLTPPMPMVKVLEGLAPPPVGALLLVHHMRTPPHLTAKLEEQGHRYRVWDLGPDRKDILILKAAV